jgi:phosphatidylglycerophosphate synthase
MMIKKSLVNALTLSRIFLSIVFCFFLSARPANVPTMTLLFFAILASDRFDGKLARRFSACTAAGAVLDVVVDLFFILSSSIVLITQGRFPFWILAVILGNFLVFLTTSMLWKAHGEDPSVPFLFDRLGRIVSASFYGLPYLMVLLNDALPPQLALYIIDGVGISLAFGATASAYFRIKYLRNACRKFFKKEQKNT